MPLYEYACACCGARFTRLQPMSAPREGHECPHCASTQTRRVVSSFAQSGSAASASTGCGPSGSPFR
jgi:putative FmdB family regulatory protein